MYSIEAPTFSRSNEPILHVINSPINTKNPWTSVWIVNVLLAAVWANLVVTANFCFGPMTMLIWWANETRVRGRGRGMWDFYFAIRNDFSDTGSPVQSWTTKFPVHLYLSSGSFRNVFSPTQAHFSGILITALERKDLMVQTIITTEDGTRHSRLQQQYQ